MIEARIVEADNKFSRNLGAKLGFADLRKLSGGDAGFQVQVINVLLSLKLFRWVSKQVRPKSPIRVSSQIPSLLTCLRLALVVWMQGSIATNFSAAANRFLNLELSALEADGDGKIISSPAL